MSLAFYDFEFNLLLVETKIISLSRTVYYNDVGYFEAHLPLTAETVKLVTENRYLAAVWNGIAAIVVGFELRDELIIYGRNCNWILSKRITPGLETVSKPGAEIACGLVSEAFSDVGNFVCGEMPESSTVSFACGQSDTLEAVKDVLAQSGLGHSLDFDTAEKCWRFNVLAGKETDLILSEANKNACNTVISSDILELATCGRYCAETEDGRVSTALEGDSEKTGIYRWEADLNGSNSTEAAVSLSKMTAKNEVTLTAGEAVLGRDYALGDVVRVQITKGVYRTTVKKRIAGAELRTDGGVYSERPIFEDL